MFSLWIQAFGQAYEVIWHCHDTTSVIHWYDLESLDWRAWICQLVSINWGRFPSYFYRVLTGKDIGRFIISAWAIERLSPGHMYFQGCTKLQENGGPGVLEEEMQWEAAFLCLVGLPLPPKEADDQSMAIGRRKHMIFWHSITNSMTRLKPSLIQM